MTLVRATLLLVLLVLSVPASVQAQAAAKKPNILVIFGDDIGIPQITPAN